MTKQLVEDSLKQVFAEKGLEPLTAGETIYGLKGRLNSLSLVRLIVELETRVQDQLGLTVMLTDNKVLSMQQSPFQTAQTLSDYLDQKIADARKSA